VTDNDVPGQRRAAVALKETGHFFGELPIGVDDLPAMLVYSLTANDDFAFLGG
jgi:hypothetical protein